MYVKLPSGFVDLPVSDILLTLSHILLWLFSFFKFVFLLSLHASCFPTLLLQSSPLWQCVLHLMPVFLQWHLCVSQVPGLQLHRFFVKEFQGDCCHAASRSVTFGWSFHPSTGIWYVPLNGSMSPAWKHVRSTPCLQRRRYIDCAFPITWTTTHGNRCKSVDARSIRGIRRLAYSPTWKVWILDFFACFCCILCAFLW